MTNFITRDRAVAVILFTGSLIWRYLALQMPPSYVKGVPGPAFFPLAISACLIVLSVILFCRKPVPEEQTATPLSATLRQAVIFALIFLYILLVPVLGFAAATVLSLTAIMLYTRQLPATTTVATALLVGASLHIAFKVFLKIPLPGGILL